MVLSGSSSVGGCPCISTVSTVPLLPVHENGAVSLPLSSLAMKYTVFASEQCGRSLHTSTRCCFCSTVGDLGTHLVETLSILKCLCTLTPKVFLVSLVATFIFGNDLFHLVNVRWRCGSHFLSRMCPSPLTYGRFTSPPATSL